MLSSLFQKKLYNSVAGFCYCGILLYILDNFVFIVYFINSGTFRETTAWFYV